MNITTSLLVILVSSAAIFFASRRFAVSSSRIGDYFSLPRAVKGATFDAIASSLPELFVALYAVIVFQEFSVGIGTIAGSALFNLLVIPGISVLVAPVVFKVSRNVISRDAVHYLVAVIALIVLLAAFKTWGVLIALFLLLLYVFYVKNIIAHTKAFKKKNGRVHKRVSIRKETGLFLFLLTIIGAFAYFLTGSAISLSYAIGVPPVIIAFTIIAVATSLPDLIISVTNAQKGDVDDAASNVFGSNTFDILIGIGLPLLIYTLFRGAIEITFSHLEIILGLLGATILLLYFFGKNRTLNKKQAKTLLVLYVLFVAYTVYLAI